MAQEKRTVDAGGLSLSRHGVSHSKNQPILIP